MASAARGELPTVRPSTTAGGRSAPGQAASAEAPQRGAAHVPVAVVGRAVTEQELSTGRDRTALLLRLVILAAVIVLGFVLGYAVVR